MPPLRILVVEDYEPFRRLVCSALRKKPEFQVIGEAADGEEAVQQAKDLQPDLVLLDIGLPKLNGFQASKEMRRFAPSAKLLFISQESSPDFVREAFRLGANGYVHKERGESDLLRAIQTVQSGETFVSDGLELKMSVNRPSLVDEERLPQQREAPAAKLEDNLFYDAFKASPIGIAIEDLEGRPLFANPALCSMLGFSEEEMRRKHCVEFSPSEDAEKDWALFEQLKAGKIDHYQIEKRFFRRNGSLVWGRLSISLLKGGNPPLVIAMVEDITEKRRVQETL